MRIQGTEVFLIPLDRVSEFEVPEGIRILYSPLKDELALVPPGDEWKELMDDFYYPEVKKADVGILYREPDHISVIPNLSCNFSCSYCYSAKGRSNSFLSWESAKTAWEYFIDRNRINSSQIHLFITGGGEPLLTWDLVLRIIRYAKQRCESLGFHLFCSIVTNGSLITKAIAKSLSEEGVSCCVSFEVLPELQSDQRAQYNLVSHNIRLLLDYKVRTLLNSTVTPSSVCFLAEMVKAVSDLYPGIAQYTLEPVTSMDLFQNDNDIKNFYDSFFKNYLEARNLADQLHVPLRFTFDDAFRGSLIRHCPGKFCLTPQGSVSICHLASSPKESRYKRCTYGQIKDGRVIIDKHKRQELLDINIFSRPSCKDCFAKWCCGGECLARQDMYPSSYMDVVCDFNRRFIKHLLIKRIEQQIFESEGVSLNEYVNR